MNSEFTIDPAHSRLGFKARHMMVTNVRGAFKDFEGTVTVPSLEDLTSARVNVAIKAASIDTGIAMRDDHLRSDDFFGAATHPEITFESTSIKKAGDGYQATGNLTIKGVTRPVTLAVEVEEPFQDPWGKQRVGLTATGKLNRSDWGLNYNQVLDAGRLMVGDEITLEIEAAFVREAVAAIAA